MRMSLREIAISKPIACSETSMELQPAALQTLMPNSSAAARSIRSTPTPVRQTTLVFFSCEMISLVKGTEPCMMIPSASRPISMTSASLVGRAITSSASISSRMGLMRSTGTSLLPKYLTRNLAIASYAPQSKCLGRIIPKNLAARFDGDFIVAADRAYRLVRELVDGVAVRVVGGDHQVIVADVLDENGGQLFSGLTTHPTIAFEIIAGLFFGDFGRAVGLMFPMLVHALQPERHPAATGLEVRDFQFGELFQHAVGAKVETSEHLFQRMASDMTAEFTVAIRASLRQHRASAFMDANCYA